MEGGKLGFSYGSFILGEITCKLCKKMLSQTTSRFIGAVAVVLGGFPGSFIFFIKIPLVFAIIYPGAGIVTCVIMGAVCGVRQNSLKNGWKAADKYLDKLIKAVVPNMHEFWSIRHHVHPLQVDTNTEHTVVSSVTVPSPVTQISVSSRTNISIPENDYLEEQTVVIMPIVRFSALSSAISESNQPQQVIVPESALLEDVQATENSNLRNV